MTEASYLEQAQRQGLSAKLARASWALHQRFPTAPYQLEQQGDLMTAYATANERLPLLREYLERVQNRTGCTSQVRPGNGVKSLERVMEKMLVQRSIPLDLLGAKSRANLLLQAYACASVISEECEVLSFADRFIFPQRSGYRDLQLHISLEGHIAEFKVVLVRFDDLDSYEHKLYEVRRAIEAKYPRGSNIPEMETWVLADLTAVGRQWYQRLWREQLEEESHV